MSLVLHAFPYIENVHWVVGNFSVACTLTLSNCCCKNSCCSSVGLRMFLHCQRIGARWLISSVPWIFSATTQSLFGKHIPNHIHIIYHTNIIVVIIIRGRSLEAWFTSTACWSGIALSLGSTRPHLFCCWCKNKKNTWTASHPQLYCKIEAVGSAICPFLFTFAM